MNLSVPKSELLLKSYFTVTLLSEIFAELNFVVHVLQQTLREFNLAVEWKFRFSILIKNNFIKWKERNGENEV